MNSKKLVLTFVIALFGAFIGGYTYSRFFAPEPSVITVPQKNVESKFTSYERDTAPSGYPDLTMAAEKSVHAVVHVMVKTTRNEYSSSGNPFYDFFFGPRGYDMTPQPQTGFGSGVIISPDGYIVTNNHVIENADEIEVTLNDKRSFTAKLVGTDPTTDIALIKIDAKNLSYLTYGNSDNLKIGEWVIAVGNPFNLTSTVTAGIVSAKSRSINILANQNQTLGIESFIQTDAAVNPGNSGGALVNTKGELVGINTAIASQTGSYTGYSFAVPVSIAKKVVNDLMQYGVVQRALLGVNIRDIDNKLLEDKNIDKIEGVYVVSVGDNSGAKAAGMKADDIILSVDDEKVNSVPELQEQISKHRPGDQVKVLIKREGKEKLLNVTLRNTDGSTAIVKAEDVSMVLGAKLKELPEKEKNALQLESGIQVSSLQPGKLKSCGMREGFIITKANRVPIKSVDDFKQVVATANEGLFLTGLYPNGRVEYYAINLSN